MTKPATPTDSACSAVLNFSGRDLDDLPEELFTIPRGGRLEELNLWRNRITQLPARIGELRSLRVLIVADNLLTSLPKEIGRLACLETLDLGHNRLATVPEELGDLAGLTR